MTRMVTSDFMGKGCRTHRSIGVVLEAVSG